MWHAYPDNAIQIQVKRNPGQTTSSECRNNGCTQIATILGVRSDNGHYLFRLSGRR